MPLNMSRPAADAVSLDEIEKTQVRGLNDRVQDQELPSPAGNTALDSVDDIALAATYQDDILPVSGTQQGKQKDVPGTATSEESVEARLGRLGRVRPEVFHSIWSEAGFVFSISMCQVLSVILVLRIDHSNH